MMIGFIAIKSGLVPLMEGQCAQICLRFEISVVLLTSSSFLSCERAVAFYQDDLISLSRETKRAGSPDDPQRGWLLRGTNA